MSTITEVVEEEKRERKSVRKRNGYKASNIQEIIKLLKANPDKVYEDAQVKEKFPAMNDGTRSACLHSIGTQQRDGCSRLKVEGRFRYGTSEAIDALRLKLEAAYSETVDPPPKEPQDSVNNEVEDE